MRVFSGCVVVLMLVTCRGQLAAAVCGDDGATEVPIDLLPTRLEEPDWSPDGSQLVFSELDQSNDGLYIVSSSGGQPSLLVSPGRAGSWSLDGTDRIAFHTSDHRVWTIPASGGPPTQITDFPSEHPDWSPDGSKLVYASNGDIWVIPSAGGTPTNLTAGIEPKRSEGNPAWSIDGSWIAFTSAGDIWIIPAEGGIAQQITNTPETESNPCWFLFSTWVAYDAQQPDGSAEVWVSPTPWGPSVEPVQITSALNSSGQPSWSLDGNRVAFESNRCVFSQTGIWLIDFNAAAVGVPGQLSSFGSESFLHVRSGGPNPFIDAVTIPFSLKRHGRVTVAIHDLSGRIVARLLDAEREAGDYEVAWSGRTDTGSIARAGVYFYTVGVGTETAGGRVTRLR